MSSDSLAEMVGDPRRARSLVVGNETDYGLGIQVWSRFGGRRVDGLLGHGGGIPGYDTLVAHGAETGMTAF